ncbi:hypothetical protein IP92_03178 [Pseudoduganella flava]|uniref:Uncharacterized protein n=1 Tax=Pseudoduganella flava TaxID=871742 RepID=A0A562PQU8_9BURK|nr:hypothetical protein [Pseudoduganella flava]QGZ42463.1 hypothetical protein GO485_27810 [Pseudoduganella flava]TWI46815.1 hypothetical protein IP92_03178 [Pseudoduganella flava]
MAHEHHEHGHDHGHSHDVAVFQHGRPPVDRSAIQGWGADLDRKNRPGVPMERTPPRIDAPLTQPEQQPETVEVLVSPERPGITPLYGSPNPPRGVSGMLRRAAFKETENDLRHWWLLMLADRVDVVEGLVEDLARGHVPNVLGEMGIKAEWQHNKRGLAQKAAIGAAAAGIAWYLLKRRRG